MKFIIPRGQHMILGNIKFFDPFKLVGRVLFPKSKCVH
jgi:hypothetical protein